MNYPVFETKIRSKRYQFADRSQLKRIQTTKIHVYEVTFNSTILGRDISVYIATRYGLDGPGIGPPSLLYNGYRVSFPEVKRLGRGVKPHPI